MTDMVSERSVEPDATPEAGASRRVIGFVVPTVLADLGQEIERSREMLDLPDNWDDEGSPGYAEATWQRAIGFLVRNATRLWEEEGVAVEAPRVRKGPDGSIDLDWRTPNRELLVNIPASPDEPATYYGDDGAGGHTIKGTLNPSESNRWLLLWLTE